MKRSRGTARGLDLDVRVAADEGVFARAHEDPASAAVQLHAAREDVDLGPAAARVDPEERAGRRDDRGVVGVEAQGPVRRGLAHLDRHAAAGEHEDRAVVVRLVRAVEPLEPELRAPVQAHDVAVRKHRLDARAAAGDEDVAGQDGHVEARRRVLVRRRHEGDLGADEGQVRVSLALRPSLPRARSAPARRRDGRAGRSVGGFMSRLRPVPCDPRTSATSRSRPPAGTLDRGRGPPALSAAGTAPQKGIPGFGEGEPVGHPRHRQVRGPEARGPERDHHELRRPVASAADRGPQADLLGGARPRASRPRRSA